MARTLSIGLVAVAISLFDGGFWATRLAAQQPDWYVWSHPYLSMARSNESQWRTNRVAARFDYQPYFPGHAQRQKPFEFAAARVSRGVYGDAIADRHAALLRELANELEYYGFEDFAGDYIP
jgi:hypothetical protein